MATQNTLAKYYDPSTHQLTTGGWGFFVVPTSQGKSAVVDGDIYPLVSQYKWTISNRRNGQRFYAYRHVRMDDGSLKALFLHHVVIGCPLRKGMTIDHIDGDGLNNTRANLRIVTQNENLTNSRARREGRTYSAFPGVTWHKGKNRWYSSIRSKGKTRFLGLFKDESEAAKAYQAARVAA
jgi:hypothetical protein